MQRCPFLRNNTMWSWSARATPGARLSRSAGVRAGRRNPERSRGTLPSNSDFKMKFTEQYDVVVVGAGHAGCEAAMAAARIGLKNALYTLNVDIIAQLSW